MGQERVSVKNIKHVIIQVTKVKELFNYRVLQKEHVLILPNDPFEPWLGHAYASKEIIYPERAAFFLPKASPLTVLTTNY